jgi:hypothetical protein
MNVGNFTLQLVGTAAAVVIAFVLTLVLGGRCLSLRGGP